MSEVSKQYEVLTRLLIEKKLTITAMESCTAGKIMSLITDTEGSSAVTKGGFVTYSNEAKIMQGVPAEIIKNFGVYSKETALAMAKACRNTYQADIGLGITGTFGNLDPNNPDSEAGKVFFAIDMNGEVMAYERMLDYQPSRNAYKLAIAQEVASVLLKKINM